jgi:predicted GNAT family acetyltransferase
LLPPAKVKITHTEVSVVCDFKGLLQCREQCLLYVIEDTWHLIPFCGKVSRKKLIFFENRLYFGQKILIITPSPSPSPPKKGEGKRKLMMI